MCRHFWSENLKEKDISDDAGVDGRIIIEYILEKEGEKLFIGFIRLRTETSGGPL
jgi:hypothetical protein